MKIKFVHDGTGPSSKNGDGEFTIEMKTVPQAGDRVRLLDGSTVEIIGITHAPQKSDFAATATIRPLQ